MKQESEGKREGERSGQGGGGWRGEERRASGDGERSGDGDGGANGTSQTLVGPSSRSHTPFSLAPCSLCRRAISARTAMIACPFLSPCGYVSFFIYTYLCQNIRRSKSKR